MVILYCSSLIVELIMPASVDVLASDPYSNNVAVFNSKTTKGSTSVDCKLLSVTIC